jgi:hypothetical protein
MAMRHVIWTSPNLEVTVEGDDVRVEFRSDRVRNARRVPRLPPDVSGEVLAAVHAPREGTIEERGLARDGDIAALLGRDLPLEPHPPLRVDMGRFVREERREPRADEVRRWRVRVDGLGRSGQEGRAYDLACAGCAVADEAGRAALADGIEASAIWLEGWSPLLGSAARWVRALDEASDEPDFGSSLRAAARLFPGLPETLPDDGDEVDMTAVAAADIPRAVHAEFQQVLCELADRHAKRLYVGLRAAVVGSHDWWARFGFHADGDGGVLRNPRPHGSPHRDHPGGVATQTFGVAGDGPITSNR